LHSGIGYHTPWSVHHGLTDQIDETRQAALTRAWTAHPERIRQCQPTTPGIPSHAWINQPQQQEATLNP
ncbi:MAG: IS3 family transposase, partial [Propionibacteriaceae bacterium]|nr:IS3 family transposase [Propionibacteriaceae bacterium]